MNSCLAWLDRLSSMRLHRAVSLAFANGPSALHAVQMMRYQNNNLIKCYRRMNKVHADVKTLVLGSSHAHHGFIADADLNEFNLGDFSCDLYHDSAVFQYWKKQGMPLLRNVVLFFDIFSPGDVIEKSSEAYRAICYRELYRIPYQVPCDPNRIILGYRFDLLERAMGAIGMPGLLGKGFCGNCDFENVVYDCLPENAQGRAEGHLKIGRENTQMKWLDQLLASMDQAKLYIVVPPLSSVYMKFTPAFDVVYSSLLSWLKGHADVVLINFWGSTAFNDGDFGDVDHLNRKGASKLSRMIREDLGCDEFV